MRRIPAKFYLTVFCLMLLGYFAHQGIHGKHGLEASRGVHAELAALQAELKGLEDQKVALRRRISLMYPESLDPDLLDESARSTLSYAHRDEVIILNAPK